MVIECKRPCKKKRSTMLTVEQMADIALGTPEIGAVNFNVLHALLHVIIQQLNIKNCLVEFKGYESDRMEGIILSAKPGPILKLSEYVIDTTEDGKICEELKEKAAKEGQETLAERGYRGPVCECGRKKRPIDEDKEKQDKGKDESEAEDKKPFDSKRKRDSKNEKETDDYESKKLKEAKESKEDRGEKGRRDTSIEATDKRKSTDGTERKNTIEGRDGTERKGTIEGRDGTERKGTIEGRDGTERKGTIEGRDGTERKGTIEGRDGTERKGTIEGRDGSGRKSTIEGRDGTEKIDRKDSRSGNEKSDRKESKDIGERRDRKASKDRESGEREEKKKCCPCKIGRDVSTLKNASFADENVKAVSSAYYGSEAEAPCKTILRVEPVGEKCEHWRSRPALAHESLVRLEEKVAMLQDAFEALEKMPTNEELKQRAESGAPSTPVKDLWQTYNLHKRVESCEGTIEKLASMIEDIVKETCKFKEAVLVIADAVDDMEYNEASAKKDCCAALEGRRKSFTPRASASRAPEGPQMPLQSQFSIAPPPTNNYLSTVDTSQQQQQQPQRTSDGSKSVRPSSVTFQNPDPEDISGQSPSGQSPKGQSSVPIDKKDTKPSRAVVTGSESSQRITDSPGKSIVEFQDGGKSQAALQDKNEDFISSFKGDNLPCNRISSSTGAPPLIGPEYCKMSPPQKFCALKDNIDWLNCQIRGLTDNFPVAQIGAKLCALVSLQKQVDALEKEWRSFVESLGGEENGMQATFANLRSESQSLNNIVSKLTNEKQELDGTMKNILLEIQMLKNVKADMEVVEDLLAEKADASAVNRKVSHDQFDAACDDLTRGLDGALDLLMKQEDVWRETLEDLYKDLDSKLNKNEIMPLKEFINKKLKCLQEKLKQLAQLRKDAEAAGAKSRILRNLNCISCDGDVVMKMDNTSSFQCPSLPATKSIKPMITYELDQVRKAMKKGPCKTSTQVEDATADMQKKISGIPLTQREAIDHKLSRMAHFCNRYCGGSHTITTAAQRVTRIGHFLTEFGPQALAMFDQATCESKQAFGQGIEVNYEKPYR